MSKLLQQLIEKAQEDAKAGAIRQYQRIVADKAARLSADDVEFALKRYVSSGCLGAKVFKGKVPQDIDSRIQILEEVRANLANFHDGTGVENIDALIHFEKQREASFAMAAE